MLYTAAGMISTFNSFASAEAGSASALDTIHLDRARQTGEVAVSVAEIVAIDGLDAIVALARKGEHHFVPKRGWLGRARPCANLRRPPPPNAPKRRHNALGGIGRRRQLFFTQILFGNLS